MPDITRQRVLWISCAVIVTVLFIVGIVYLVPTGKAETCSSSSEPTVAENITSSDMIRMRACNSNDPFLVS